MLEPSPLPAALIADPPIPADDMAALVAALHQFVEDQGVDLETAADVALAGMLETDAGPPVPEVAQGFRVHDHGSAEWAMRHLREADAYLEEVQAQADQWIREVQEWANREARRPLATRAYMEALLRDYGARRRAEDPGAATIRLPSGVIETTARKAAVKVTDPDAVLAYAKEHAPLVVEVIPATERVTARAAKELGKITEDRVQEEGSDREVVVRSFVDATGKPVPGMEVEPPRLDVRVKPGPT